MPLFFAKSAGSLTASSRAASISRMWLLLPVLCAMLFFVAGKGFASGGALQYVKLDYWGTPFVSMSGYMISANETIRMYPGGTPIFKIRVYRTSAGSNPWTFSVTAPSGAVSQWTTPAGISNMSYTFNGNEQGTWTANVDNGPAISWNVIFISYSTITTVPAGCSYKVDGTTYTSGKSFEWDSKSSHTLSAVTPQQCGGKRNAFRSWSDSGAIAHTITVPDIGDSTYTANFTPVLPAWDVDADQKQDVAVLRSDTGTWYSVPSGSPGNYAATQWGIKDDKPVPGDYDGDGKSDAAVWRPANGMWYVLKSSVPGDYTLTRWGMSSDVPAPGDYDGDGKTDIAVWRRSSGTWYVLSSATPGSYTAIQWGASSDVPVPGDYDGDSKTDIAVRRPGSGTWYVLKSSVQGAYTTIKWGADSDKPVPADYDGDGKTNIAVWRPGNGTWYILPDNATGYTTTAWGANGDIPVPGDYDADGLADIAVWRPGSGIWYVKPSGTPGNYTARQWGTAGDTPISSSTTTLNSIP